MKKKLLLCNSIQLLVFDFDGVMTDNSVYLNEQGMEFVKCNRSDGLAINALKKSNIRMIILSTEVNNVVKARARKLGLRSITGIKDKKSAIKKYSQKNNIKLKNILYVGNDLNDYHSMKLVGMSACPADSHEEIKKISKYVLKTKGGEGVISELTEKILDINILKLLYG